MWNFDLIVDKIPKLKDPILIVGLPGIANVGKITADFLVDELEAELLYDINSHDLPSTVFINEENLIELPVIEIRKAHVAGRDVLILTGDVQPSDEACYAFCEELLLIAKRMGVSIIVTLGGIGLADEPAKPKVFCTGNSSDVVKSFVNGLRINTKLYGLVGPIIGVSGLLTALAAKYDIDAVCLLAETLGHPAFLGMNGAREIVRALNKTLDLGIDMKNINKEIKQIEKDIKEKAVEIENMLLEKIGRTKKSEKKVQSYIG